MNRPFDDQSQNRVRLEAEAVLSILEMADNGKLELAGSDIIDDELSQMPDGERREKVKLLLGSAAKRILLTVDHRTTRDGIAEVEHRAAGRLASCFSGGGAGRLFF